MATDIHRCKKALEAVTRRIRQSDSLGQVEKEDILAFQEECFAEGLSLGRIVRYMFDLLRLHEWRGRGFRALTMKEAKTLVARIEQSSYAPITKRDLKITLRKYVRFLRGTASMPREVSWIRPSAGVRRTKLPEEILTEEEVGHLIQAADRVRDRAFIATLYESGCRIGEILGLRIRHVRPLDVGMQLRVDGKTGPRRIRVIACAPHLTELLNVHPGSDRGDDPLWVTRTGNVLTYASAAALMRRLVRRAGINKRMFPHLFRHSRATHLASHLTEAQMKEYFGWVQDSGMAAVYVHMSGRDVDSAILELNGVRPKKKLAAPPMTPKACSRCKAKNPAAHRYCMTCGHPLDKKVESAIVKEDMEMKEASGLLDELLEDQEFRQLMEEKLEQIGRRRRRTSVRAG